MREGMGHPADPRVWNLKPGAIDTFLRREMDLLDAKTSRHGECEFASETDAAVLRVILKVRDGAGGSYYWVECGSCGGALGRFGTTPRASGDDAPTTTDVGGRSDERPPPTCRHAATSCRLQPANLRGTRLSQRGWSAA